MFNASLALKQELKEHLDCHFITVQLLIESKTLLDVILKGTKTSEKMLMLEFACAQEKFRKTEISNIELIRSNVSLADELTKQMNHAKLQQVMSTGNMGFKVQELIVRD